MKAATRIYVVAPKVSDGPAKRRLVRAAHSAAALRHVVEDTLVVTVASQDDLVDCVANGVKVEDATAQQQGEGA